MQITMKSLYASAAGALQPGDTADVPPALGKALIAGGYATAGKEERSPDDANALNSKAKRGGRGGVPTGKRGRSRGDAGDGQGDDGTGDPGTGDGSGAGDPGDGDQSGGDGDSGDNGSGDGNDGQGDVDGSTGGS